MICLVQNSEESFLISQPLLLGLEEAVQPHSLLPLAAKAGELWRETMSVSGNNVNGTG